MIYFLLFLSVVRLPLFSNGANILAVISLPSYSHQIPFRPLWIELSLRGHNVTLITSHPIRNSSLTNLTEHDVGFSKKFMKEYKFVESASDDSQSFIEIGKQIKKMSLAIHSSIFESDIGQNLIHNKDNRFDLLIAEAQFIQMFIFSWKYQIPYIGVSSLDCSLQYHDTMGNPTHPVINPDTNLPIANVTRLTFLERFKSFLFATVFKWIVYTRGYDKDRENLVTYFGENVPPLIDLQNNMSMLFIATNPIFHFIRPLMPNTITLGNGIHMSKVPRPLPEVIENFLNTAKNGSIYFSLGSNIKGTLLNDTIKSELIKAFDSLPQYNFLWKFDEEFVKLPKNVQIYSWVPQEDILGHPNVKAFITQGGLQSLQETLYYDKPAIGIPFFGDQIMNVRRMVHFGYGMQIDRYNITKESIKAAVIEIIENPKYRQKAEEYGDIFRDVEMSNVDKAVWWTEYVLRHNGAPHFKNPAVNMPFWKYFMLDVIATVLTVLCALVFLVLYIFKLLVKVFVSVLLSSRHKKHEKLN